MEINKPVTKTSSLESTQGQFCTVLSSQERPLLLLTWQNSSVNENIWCLNATFRMLCTPLPQHYTLLELQQEQRWVFPARLSSYPAPWDLFYLQTSGCQTLGVCWTQGWQVTHYNRANTQPVVFSITVQSAQLIHSILLMCIYIYMIVFSENVTKYGFLFQFCHRVLFQFTFLLLEIKFIANVCGYIFFTPTFTCNTANTAWLHTLLITKDSPHENTSKNVCRVFNKHKFHDNKLRKEIDK